MIGEPKPTIFRATEQWFASVNGFRSSALKAIEDVEWMPATERKEFILWSLVEVIGVFLDKDPWVPIPVFLKKW